MVEKLTWKQRALLAEAELAELRALIRKAPKMHVLSADLPFDMYPPFYVMGKLEPVTAWSPAAQTGKATLEVLVDKPEMLWAGSTGDIVLMRVPDEDDCS